LGDTKLPIRAANNPAPNASCNLGSINLANFISGKKLDYKRLGETIDHAVQFLDDVIDINKFPLKKIETMVKKTRKIGLGVMGFADILFKMGIPYDSEEALQVADELMKFFYTRTKDASAAWALAGLSQLDEASIPRWANSAFHLYHNCPDRYNSMIALVQAVRRFFRWSSPKKSWTAPSFFTLIHILSRLAETPTFIVKN
jgi:hypothetical protein